MLSSNWLVDNEPIMMGFSSSELPRLNWFVGNKPNTDSHSSKNFRIFLMFPLEKPRRPGISCCNLLLLLVTKIVIFHETNAEYHDNLHILSLICRFSHHGRSKHSVFRFLCITFRFFCQLSGGDN